MNKTPNAILMLPLLGALALGGCGESFTVAEGGIGGTGISTGTVTGIGSITVNGVKFNTDNAAIYVEGVRVDDPSLADGDELSLRGFGFSEGQVVRVVGSFNADGKTGTADAVYYNDSIEGPVENITPLDAATQQDATSLRLQVMGQQVIIDNQTILEGTTIAGISVNDLIEVSGLQDDAGQIRAGYLEYHGGFSNGGAVELKGIIDGLSLNPVAQTFTINGLHINYGNAIELPSGGLQEGMQVEVKGSYDGNQVDALTIEQEDDIDSSENDEVEYEGIVTDASVYSVNGRFNLGNEVVQTTSSTIYIGGLASDIIAGVRLEVEGRWQAGTLIAGDIRFHDEIELDGRVANVLTITSESVTFDLTNLAGITVQVTNLSKIEGDADNLTTLANRLTNSGTNSNPDYVEVRGRQLGGSGTKVVFAEEIKIEDGSNEDNVKLQGPVESINEPEVTILGINVDTTNIGEFEGPEDTRITRAQFFTTVVSGNIIGVEGVLSGSTIDWDSIELEDVE
jgi:hypothetical protein